MRSRTGIRHALNAITGLPITSSPTKEQMEITKWQERTYDMIGQISVSEGRTDGRMEGEVVGIYGRFYCQKCNNRSGIPETV